MPSTLPTERDPSKGTLFVVATPIGHLEDITIRAIRILTEADLIVAEDTRQTRKLLTRYDINTTLISFHDHNKEKKTPQILRNLRNGMSVAVVSDAGTPCVSDPGYYLVKHCVEEGIGVSPVPGASAAVAALSASGLPSDSFVFLGFAPRKKKKRTALLQQLQQETRTLIFYESPKRVQGFIQELRQILGDRTAVLARELTKVHEEMLRGKLGDIYATLSERSAVKGECTLLVRGCPEASRIGKEKIRQVLEHLHRKEGKALSEAAKEVAAMYGLPKSQVYKEAMDMEKE